MAETHIHIIIIIICIINSILHLSGMYFLTCLRYSAMNGCQRLFLFHLSLSEFGLTFLETTKRIVYIVINTEESIITEYINIIQFSSTSMVYYFIMIYLTVDRFFELYLNMKYPFYRSERKTRHLLRFTWIVFVTLAILLSVLYKYYSIDYNKLFYIYIWPITEVIFVIVAIGTYGYVMRMIYENKKSINLVRRAILHSVNNDNLTAGTQNRSVFKESAFYLPTLIILTFVLFQVVPDLTVFFVMISGRTISEGVYSGVFITYMFSIFTDAVIYIFLSPYVKGMLIRKLIKVKIMKQKTIHHLQQRVAFRTPICASIML